ncbi:helix-turn-helix domain-containing protein [Hoeflea ulvae]|uniref:Transposase n=1 Tax=Hoeflea ulvae TaxID=2983764 RepID=A0ABT3YEU2_9HYPH|nr:helix-turn-helix domain-containing protein [Hoeflea ulvae]MCY0094411.1 transposase [Hoeflea ulvae]
MTETPSIPSRCAGAVAPRGRMLALPPACLLCDGNRVGHSLSAIAAMAARRPDGLTVRSDRSPVTRSGRRRQAAARRIDPVDVLSCRIVGRLVTELFSAACAAELPAIATRRRPQCHRRQIAMYLSHVVLSVPFGSIALAFGRDRTTVMHACSVTEDRRDDAGYDRFVEMCERCVDAVFAPIGADHDAF